MRLIPRSLTFRVIALSTIWAIVAMVVIATVISTLYRQSSERSFSSLLSAHLFNLVGAVRVSGDGQLTGDPNLGDLRFTQPRSGWYWAVDPVSEWLEGELRSFSMVEEIPPPSAENVPFDDRFQRSYTTTGLDGETIEVLETEYVLDDDDSIARFRVMGNRSELAAEIAAFDRQIYTYLSLFGLGLVAINALSILFGLRPLGQVRRALSDIREGTARRLDGEFPAEIAPLANETNALIESNRRIVERARTQVGNLAHSLKTPLTVLLNEGRKAKGRRGDLVVEQASAMQQQLDHYLQRARIAAQRDSLIFRTRVAPLLESMVRVIGKINPDKTVELVLPSGDPIFAGEKEDLEEIIGNLLENAMKWARSHVRVVLTGLLDGEDDQTMFELSIEDDGPGIPLDKAREALKRGRRLDESKPGTGLGLSIVADLVGEYGGSIALDRSDLGGLKAGIRLKAARE